MINIEIGKSGLVNREVAISKAVADDTILTASNLADPLSTRRMQRRSQGTSPTCAARKAGSKYPNGVQCARTWDGASGAADQNRFVEIDFTKERHMAAKIVICSLVVLLAGCATTFTGDPHVENGRSGCEIKCKDQAMELAGMVYMGEYSSACVCEVPGQHASRRQLLLGSAGAVGGGIAAVEAQRREQERTQP